MDKEEVSEDNQETPPPDNAIIDIGTEPVGESDTLYTIGTDTVLGSEPPHDDTIHLIGTERVGKSLDPDFSNVSDEEGGES